MKFLPDLLASLLETHQHALEWFIINQGTEQSWPAPLDENTFLVNKAKGIHKPNWTNYALSVRQSLGSPYPDRDPIYRADGTWIYQYHQETTSNSSGDNLFTNRALMACWQDEIPIGVMRQIKRKPNPRYEVLGIALVAGWEDGYFFFEGFSPNGYSRGRGPQAQLNAIIHDLKEVEPEFPTFNPDSITDARIKTMASIVQRQGQRAFRELLLKAYEHQCSVTRCDVVEVLEAAHIIPYQGLLTNHISNGLLLRADIHTLFDTGLVAVETDTLGLIISPKLVGSVYESLRATRLRTPSNTNEGPNIKALQQHRQWAGL